ncbi:MAG: amino acid ABC transporter substrate-binding protein [Hungatella sp.]
MKKAVFGMMLAGCMMASLVGCSTKNTNSAGTTAETKAADTKAADTKAAETAAAGGTFTVGFDQDFPPMGFLDDKGEYTGFDLELAREVAKRLGLEFVPQPIAWDAKDMELSSGTIDCIWNGFTMNGREDAYTWSAPYMDNSQVFVVAKDSGITTWADLAGKTVEVQADSSAEAALKDNSALAGTFGMLQKTPDYNTAFMDLEMGTVDAIAMDVIVAGYQIEQRKADFIILDETLASEKYGIGFKLGNDALKDRVQKTLEEMAADGTMRAVSEKWFGVDVTTIGK